MGSEDPQTLTGNQRESREQFAESSRARVHVLLLFEDQEGVHQLPEVALFLEFLPLQLGLLDPEHVQQTHPQAMGEEWAAVR